MPEPGWPCLGGADGALQLALSVVPNARRTGLDGLHDGALRVRLAAPPVDGRANEALVAWVAAELGLPRRAVRLLRGAGARRKQLAIDAPRGVVEKWLNAHCIQP